MQPTLERGLLTYQAIANPIRLAREQADSTRSLSCTKPTSLGPMLSLRYRLGLRETLAVYDFDDFVVG